jgi:hypothetical protein
MTMRFCGAKQQFLPRMTSYVTSIALLIVYCIRQYGILIGVVVVVSVLQVWVCRDFADTTVDDSGH